MAWATANWAWGATSAASMRGRRVGPDPQVVPAAELDRTELRVFERVPVDVLVRGVLLDPPEHGEALLVGRADVPEVRRLLLAGGGVDDVPELGGPREHAEVLVRPVVGGAAHRVRLVPREVLEDRVHGIRGQRRADRAELLPGPQVLRWDRRIGLRRRRSQQHAAAGVEGVVPADVGPGDDGPHQGVDLRLRQRMVARPAHLRRPAGREVAVEVETLRRPRCRDGESVEVLDGPFDQQPVARRAARRTGRAARGSSVGVPRDGSSRRRPGRAGASAGLGRHRRRPRCGHRATGGRRDTATAGCSIGGTSVSRRAPTRRRRG